jgi:hypothetical protein
VIILSEGNDNNDDGLLLIMGKSIIKSIIKSFSFVAVYTYCQHLFIRNIILTFVKYVSVVDTLNVILQ